MSMLSGGNPQKIVLARALYREPTVLLPHDGTRGVDVGTKADIFALVAGLAAKGTSVVFCSSDLSALAHFCDRVYVMAEGRVRGRLDAAGGELSEESILRLALTPGADDGRARPRARPVRGRHPRRRDGGHRLRAGRRTRLDRPRPGVGIGLGLLNGLLVGPVGMQPCIVTLAAWTIFNGIALTRCCRCSTSNRRRCRSRTAW
ncbi:hypothetical protein ACFQH9_05895 [Pseudonocardia lutea]|uniref:ABC transporter domain-containing protein n=1 Tax=Pseudonocardia lutea TaxID=2172015 RepID=A0ABW1I4F6_9PSEU